MLDSPARAILLAARSNPMRSRRLMVASQDVPQGSSSRKRGSHSSLYRPGDPVRQSGIYEVLHDGQHRSAHEVVMIAGDEFPACDTCMDRVRFRLVRTAPYIFQDDDFEEPGD